MPRICLACLGRRLAFLEMASSSVAKRSYAAVPKTPKPPRLVDQQSPKRVSAGRRPTSPKRSPAESSKERGSFGLRLGHKDEKPRANPRGSDPLGAGVYDAGPSRTSGTRPDTMDVNGRPTNGRSNRQEQAMFPSGPSRMDPDKVVKQRGPLYPPRQEDSPPKLDFSSLPPHPCPRSRTHFVGLHHDTAISAFHRPSTPSHPIIKYRDQYLHLRAIPSSYLPKPPPSPFPLSIPAFKDKHPSRPVIAFGVLASKNAVSALAPERGRVRKKFKAAVEGVVNRSWGVVESSDIKKGADYLQSDWSYMAVLNREVYEATMPELCQSLVTGLKFIRKQQDRGIGTKTGQHR